MGVIGLAAVFVTRPSFGFLTGFAHVRRVQQQDGHIADTTGETRGPLTVTMASAHEKKSIDSGSHGLLIQ